MSQVPIIDLAVEVSYLRKYLQPSTTAINDDIERKRAHMLNLLDSRTLLQHGYRDDKPVVVPTEWVKKFGFEKYGMTPTFYDCARALDPDAGIPTIAAMRDISLFLNTDDKPNPLFCVLLDYMATGEGSTRRFLAFRAETEADALYVALRKLGGYFMLGADIYEGVPPDHHLTDLMVTDRLKSFLQRMAEKPEGQIDVDFELHINFS